MVLRDTATLHDVTFPLCRIHLKVYFPSADTRRMTGSSLEHPFYCYHFVRRHACSSSDLMQLTCMKSLSKATKATMTSLNTLA